MCGLFEGVRTIKSGQELPRGLFEGACTIKSGQELPCELFEGAIFSRARSDQGNTVHTVHL